MSEERGDRHPGARLEATSALVISIAALLSAWAAYQATLWDGEQSSRYIRANALRINASRAALADDVRLAAEIDLWNRWLEATASGNAGLANFFRARFPADMKPAFNAWLREQPFTNPSAAPTPFHMATYHRKGRAEAERLEKAADDAFRRGEAANDISDAFSQATALMAMAMFFGGIGQIFNLRRARLILLAVAAVAMVLGIGRLVSLPIYTLGFGLTG